MTADRTAYDPFAPPPARAPAPAPAVAEPVVEAPSAADLDDISAQLPSDLDDITKDDLIALAELADVATYGTKQAIADRIRAAAA